MNETFMNLTLDNLDTEHICCAISDKKHQVGVSVKKQWLKKRIEEGHVFRKLDQKGKVFIEYAPIETAWVPVSGENYLYIYCLWVAGSFKKKDMQNLYLSIVFMMPRKLENLVYVFSVQKRKSLFYQIRNFF